MPPANRKEYQDRWYRENRERVADRSRRFRRKLRQDVVTAYGGKCECCGETEMAFLTLDHINGGGRAERERGGDRGQKIGGEAIYSRLRREGYPPGFRILCWNCNAATHFAGGVCPHQQR